jgi:hypothetical protein
MFRLRSPTPPFTARRLSRPRSIPSKALGGVFHGEEGWRLCPMWGFMHRRQEHRGFSLARLSRGERADECPKPPSQSLPPRQKRPRQNKFLPQIDPIFGPAGSLGALVEPHAAEEEG